MRLREAIPGATAAIANIRRAFQRKWFTALARYRAGLTALAAGTEPATGAAGAALVAALETAWHETIDTGWKEGYRLGFAVRARQAAKEIPETLLDKIAAQKRFASKFAQDVAAGTPREPGRMNVGPRSGLYANAVGSAFNMGLVAAGPPGEVIHWRLGPAEHCSECPVLSASGPYSRDGSGGLPALPTYPRAGETECRGNCRCWLEFAAGKVTAPADARPPFVDFSLSEPPAPPGKRLPSDAEKLQIRDMESRVNFARRKIAETAGTPDQAEWVKQRRVAAGQLRELKEKLGVWSPPRFDVKEVVTGRDVALADVDDLTTARGLDGRTINRASGERMRKLLDETRKDIETKIALLPPAGGDMPDLRAMLLRAGAPPELFPEGMSRRALGEAFEAVPSPSVSVVNVVGWGARATVENHLALLQLMADGEHDVDVGPLDDDWLELVLVGGTWLRGAHEALRAVLAAWAEKATLGIAPWRE